MDERMTLGEKAKATGGGIVAFVVIVGYFALQLLILGAVVTIALAFFRWVF